jgi:hypothetical protein
MEERTGVGSALLSFFDKEKELNPVTARGSLLSIKG